MKIRYIIFLVVVLFFHCNTTTNNNKMKQELSSDEKKYTTSLNFINKVVDFGTVNQDSLIISEFSLVNTGANKLIIKSILPDCNCTDFQLSNDTILPADTCKIWLRLNTHNKDGNVKSYTIVRVNTTDGVYKLTMKGRVVPTK